MNRRYLLAAMLAVILAISAGYVGWHSRPYVVTGWEWRKLDDGVWLMRIEYQKPLGGLASFDRIAIETPECIAAIAVGYSIPKACW